MAAGIDIAELTRAGVAVVVATRDHASRPELGRAWGPALSEDGQQLTVCVEAPPGSAMARNLAAGGPVATTLTHLSANISVQLKGQVVTVGAPTPDLLAAVGAHVDGFVSDTAAIGVPEAIARGFAGPQLVAVTIAIDGCYDDTPGPDAGARL